jgi:hypothetical protein
MVPAFRCHIGGVRRSVLLTPRREWNVTHERARAVGGAFDERRTDWGSSLERVLWQLGPRCEENRYQGGEQALVEGELHGIEQYDELKHEPSEITRSTSILRGYGGELNNVGPFNGQTFTIVYANPNLVGLELRCATVSLGANSEPALLTGYPPLEARIRTHRASKAQVRAMENAASAHHSGGFNRHKYHFLSDRTTSNGWAAARWSRFPHNAQPETIVFHFSHGAWRVITWGSGSVSPEHGYQDPFVTRSGL